MPLKGLERERSWILFMLYKGVCRCHMQMDPRRTPAITGVTRRESVGQGADDGGGENGAG